MNEEVFLMYKEKHYRNTRLQMMTYNDLLKLKDEYKDLIIDGNSPDLAAAKLKIVTNSGIYRCVRSFDDVNEIVQHEVKLRHKNKRWAFLR